MNELTTRNTGLRSMAQIEDSLRVHAQGMIVNAIGAGRDLLEAKEQLSHGEWLPWLQANNIQERNAQNYMRLAVAAEQHPKLANIGYSKALALLSAPAEAMEQMLDDGTAEEMTAAQLKTLTRKLKQAEKDRDDFQQALISTSEQLKQTEGLLNSKDADVIALQRTVRQKDDILKGVQRQLSMELSRAPQVVEKEVIREVEVIPPDVQRQLQEAKEAARLAEERAMSAMMDAAPDEADADDESHDNLPLEDLVAFANEVQARLWALPFMDWCMMQEEKRRNYRVILNGVQSLFKRIREAMDSADAMEPTESGWVE